MEKSPKRLCFRHFGDLKKLIYYYHSSLRVCFAVILCAFCAIFDLIIQLMQTFLIVHGIFVANM